MGESHRSTVRVLVIASLALLAAFVACRRSSGRTRLPNGVPQASIVFPFCCTLNGVIPVNYILMDPESDTASVTVSFSTDGGGVYQVATESSSPQSEGLTGLSTGPAPGVAHYFYWDTPKDVGYVEVPDVILRIIPSDPVPGISAVSDPFTIDNRNIRPPEVTDVSDSVINTLTNEVEIRFNIPIAPNSVVHRGDRGDSLAVYRDTNQVPGGNFTQEAGTISFSDGNRVLHYAPPFPFDRYREIRIVLTDRIASPGSLSLVPGTTYPTEPLSFTGEFPDEVFEIRFTPGIGPKSGDYPFDPNTDIWVIDFDSFGTFDGDLARRGLRGSDPFTAAYARDRVIGQILSSLNEHYLRNPDDGSEISGAYRISFSVARPAGSPGFAYSRMCLGLDFGGLWGVAWYDPGNNYRDDDCDRNIPLGVFAGGIWGKDSSLSPGLGVNDQPYVDDSYVLGTDPAQDSRFLRVRDVIWDWGHGLSVVTAHEIGHSVGLPHIDGSFDNIMQSWTSPDHISNPNARFSSPAQNLLRSNLGQVP